MGRDIGISQITYQSKQGHFARVTRSYTRLSQLLFAGMIESDSKFKQRYEYDEFNFIPGYQVEVEETTINERAASTRELDLNVYIRMRSSQKYVCDYQKKQETRH